MTIHDTVSTQATPVERGLIHDLRNLFGVVASAKHMLEDRPPDDRRATLLAAIEDAAQRGSQLTSRLLTPATASDPSLIDISNHLLLLMPMVGAMAGGRVSVRFDLATAKSLVEVVPGLFEATILELVANASAALQGAGHILIRTRLRGPRFRVTIVDDGVGMDRARVEQALSDHRRPGVRGTGLGRVRHFARLSHGHLRLRSRPGRGTIVTLVLPTVLHVPADMSAGRNDRSRPIPAPRLCERTAMRRSHSGLAVQVFSAT